MMYPRGGSQVYGRRGVEYAGVSAFWHQCSNADFSGAPVHWSATIYDRRVTSDQMFSSVKLSVEPGCHCPLTPNVNMCLLYLLVHPVQGSTFAVKSHWAVDSFCLQMEMNMRHHMSIKCLLLCESFIMHDKTLKGLFFTVGGKLTNLTLTPTNI